MKKGMVFLLLIVAAFILQAGDYDNSTLDDLKKERQQLKTKMHYKRVEIIKNDPSLMVLQKKIMAIHKELEIRVDNNEEMRELISKLRDIEREINRLEE